MTAVDLAVAGTAADPDAELAAAYRHCRSIAAAHGRTYFLATRLLAPSQRPAVHALYAFARTVDDLVDYESFDAAGQVDRIEKRLRERLAHPLPPDPEDPVLSAVAATIARYRIAPDHFWTFLDAMRMDIPGTPLFRSRYTTMAELRGYMRGSAAAIGLQLLPILGTVGPRAAAEPAAAALGEAFQLTNFLRDIGEDLDRGRIYLPARELAAFGVDDDLLAHCRWTGRTDIRLRRALAHLIATTRALYRVAEPGIELLQPRVRPAIRTAAVLYAEILTEIEESGYAVFDRRAVVPRRKRLWVAATSYAAAGVRAAGANRSDGMPRV
ncbi:phytoene/squalene synthase family protein [Nocardia terpenica]|uniref:phytoene/squalene synthase family protein n=1 Tax=Nocardia terpenica TaxID=455432 RepID=UPI001E32339D|nr:phytoene/squalene synthase family protein [Nocardia terpenica]